MKTVIKFKQDKETKGTFRFEEVTEEGKPPVIGTLYVRKWALPNPAPQTITLTLEA